MKILNNRRAIITGKLLFILFFCQLSAQNQTTNPEKYLAQLQKDLDLASISVALVKDSTIVWKGAAGKANIEQEIDFTTKHLFCLGSVSKLFTGTCLLKLYEEGKLSYVSEMGDKYEYSSKLTQLPKINGETLNLNPAKTYDTPYLSKVHGESKATISYPGYEDVVLDFKKQ